MADIKNKSINPWGDVVLPAKQTYRLSAMLLTLMLVLLNIGVYIYQDYYASPLPSRENNLLLYGANVYQLSLTGEWWRYPISIVLHADPVHLVINCLALFVIGINCEALSGKFRMLIIYAVSGIGASLFSAIWQSTVFDMNQGIYVYAYAVSVTVAVGASGAIMGIAAATAVFLFKEIRNPVLPADKRALYKRNLMFIIALMVLALISGTESDVDNSAHVSGAVIGGLLAVAYRLFSAKTSFAKTTYCVFVSAAAVILLALAIYSCSFSQDSGLLIERELIYQEINSDLHKYHPAE
ncbi:rhomboid family intramembrane serine protease [Morganella psychrotolerans]|uniref:Peptidase S54 rhomboid domain-containing protein n=1 Tax=Morganella psychrotolerans TaxID=368603 RepID=A0A1B8H577_9GAMM|nr:rhomboid family intramembrane serine protease [Morganella psychrotolerans]OBU04229.1 hypothetical protein AYY18_09825 [Morganella psychrotolerans]